MQRLPVILAASMVTLCTTTVTGLGAGSRAPDGQASAAAPDSGAAPAYEFMRRAWERMTADDRAALFEAHLAALHVGLRLTPDQERLWPALENALRAAAKGMVERRREAVVEGPPVNPVAGLRRAADRLSATSESLRNIADAAQPLYATLGEDQKRRLPILLHGLAPAASAARFGRDDLRSGRGEPRIGWGLPE